MKPIQRLYPSVMTLVLACAAYGVDPLRIDAKQTFLGAQQDTSVVTVTLENDGPDARGVLQVSGEAGPVSYPVELPRGARKRLLTFPDAQWGVVDFTLQTDQGRVIAHMPAVRTPPELGGSIALIGDDSGGLAFLRRQTEGKRSFTARDAYVKPEEAPGRPAAYRSFDAVALGPGAERMGDDAVTALRDFALSGGTVLVFGGASAPILEDPRWTALLPGHDWRPLTRSTSPDLSKDGGAPITNPYTVLAPKALVKGAVLHGDEVTRGYGLGRIVVLGYSPLEAPLNVWPGRARAVSRFLRTGGVSRSRQLLDSYLGTNPDPGAAGFTSRYSTAIPMASGRAIYSLPGAAPETDPFSTKLPEAGSVFGILALYFVLVVPVSFFALRKMNRGELAWVTAPMLALGFAGILFKSAQSLYSAALSTASQGLLVIQEGAPNGMFYGTSQVFFPRGGVYDLKLENADSMTGVQRNEYYGYGMRPNSEGLEGFNLVDVGTVRAPRLEANNLAFRELSYTQRVEAGEGFRFERVDPKHVRVENRTPWNFDGRVTNGSYYGPLLTLRPGESKVVALKEGAVAPTNEALGNRDPINFTRSGGRIALNGTLQGYRPGPQVGKEVAGRSGVAVLAFAEETVR